jgi:chromosome segregation ATPase
MSATTTLESLREALAGEHSQLESWVQESFSAMDALHSELAEWQRELARQQAEVAQREAALKESANAGKNETVTRLEQELAKAAEDARQLEEENAEQLQALQELNQQVVVAKAELKQANKRAEELNAALQAERALAAEQHRELTSELRELRRLFERQSTALERLIDESPDRSDAQAETDEATDGGGRAAELLRRASTRRAQRRPG